MGQKVGVRGSEETARLIVARHLRLLLEQEKGRVLSQTSSTYSREEVNQQPQGGRIFKPNDIAWGIRFMELLLSEWCQHIVLSRLWNEDVPIIVSRGEGGVEVEFERLVRVVMPSMRWVPHLIRGLARPEGLALKERSYHLLVYHACLESWTLCHEGLLSTLMLVFGLTWQDDFSVYK